MELELAGGEVVRVAGNVEVRLPSYVTILTQEELNAAATHRDEPVLIAAGRCPSSDEIVAMTATGSLLVLDGAAHRIPPGPVMPINGGHSLLVGGHEVAAAWFINNATVIDVTMLAGNERNEEDGP